MSSARPMLIVATADNEEQAKVQQELQQLVDEPVKQWDAIASRYFYLLHKTDETDPDFKIYEQELAASGFMSSAKYTEESLSEQQLSRARVMHRRTEIHLSKLPTPIPDAVIRRLDTNRRALAKQHYNHSLFKMAPGAKHRDFILTKASDYLEDISRNRRNRDDWEQLAYCYLEQLQRNALPSRQRQEDLVRLFDESQRYAHIPLFHTAIHMIDNHHRDLGQYHYERSAKMSKEMGDLLRERDGHSAEAQKCKNEGKAMRQAVSERLAKEASEKAEILSNKMSTCLARTALYLEAIPKHNRNQQDWKLLSRCYLEQMNATSHDTFFSSNWMRTLASLLEECRAHISADAKTDLRLFIS